MLIYEIDNYKKVTYEVEHGKFKIYIKDGTYYVEYHNHLYLETPFRLATTFSDEFTLEEVLNSSEFQNFKARFNN